MAGVRGVDLERGRRDRQRSGQRRIAGCDEEFEVGARRRRSEPTPGRHAAENPSVATMGWDCRQRFAGPEPGILRNITGLSAARQLLLLTS